jgi:peptide/nickel transport system substrate-binding protein
MHNVFQSLLRRDPDTNQLVPELAERWESSDDGLTWRFFLRNGVRFHDGRPLTAADVKFTFDRLFDPSVTAESLRGDLDIVQSVEIEPPDRIVVRTVRPYFLLLETLGWVPILPEHVYAAGDLNTHPANRAPVGTGPFRFAEWETGDRLVLRRNPDYWGPPARLGEVVFRVVRDATVALQMARRGDLDLLPTVLGDRLDEYLGSEDLRERFVPVRLDPPDFAFWVYNTARRPFDDARVRRAFTMLIDRPAVLCALERCMSRIVAQPWPPGHPAHDPDIEPYPYDPGAALALLAEAGWADHDGDGLLDREGSPLRFTFLVAAQSVSLQQMATVVQQDLDAVGITMDIAVLDWSVFSERCRTHEFDVASVRWSLRWENDFHGVFSRDGAQNYGRWFHPRADAIVTGARALLDEDRRNAEFRELARILHREQPYTFTFSPAVISLVHRDLRGVAPSLEWFQLARIGWTAEGDR